MNQWNPHKLKDQSGKELNYVPSFTNFALTFQKNLLKRFEELQDKVSIIIQGPIHQRSINTIPEYLKYGEVVVSCWNNDNLNAIQKYKNKITLVVNDFKKASRLSVNSGAKNPYIFQNYSTLEGLKAAKNFLAIKFRSDESYPVIDPILKKIKENRDTKDKQGNYNNFKLVTSNIYFRFDDEIKFHPSDHFIGGERNRMIKVFEKSTKLASIPTKLSPEQVICKSALETYFDPINKCYDKFDFSKSIELMQKHFDIIRINSLPRCIWTSSYRKYDALKGEERWCHNIKELSRKKLTK
jgi:hypothetical protein